MNSGKEITVSVIIPVHNEEKYLVECLNSITAQTYPNIEIIIINDYSTDQTSQILQIYDFRNTPHKIYNSSTNLGVSESRNLGIKLASGRLILFVDADDILHTDAIEKTVAAYLKYHCTIKFSYYLKYRKHLKSPVSSSKNQFTEWKTLLAKFILNQEKCFVPCFLFEKKLLVKNSILFNPEQKFMEELDFVSKIAKSEQNTYIVKDKLYEYRQVKTSASRIIDVQKRLKRIENYCQTYYNYFSMNSSEKIIFVKNIIDLYLKTEKYVLRYNKATAEEYNKSILSAVERLLLNNHLKISDCSFGNRLLYFLIQHQYLNTIKTLDLSRNMLLSLTGRGYYE